MKIFTRIIATILFVFIGFVGFIYFSPDYNMYFVRSGSMTPAINVGDLVITGPAGGPLSPDMETGTVITYQMANGEEVTHRIIDVTAEQTYITQGDASEDPDRVPVSPAQVQGVYLFKIPYVGYITSFIQTKTGWFAAIIIPAMILVVLIIKDIVKIALRGES